MPNYPYILFLVTFLGGPVIAGIVVRIVHRDKLKQSLKILIPLLLFKNALGFFHLSFRGDYADYTILATEYLTVCVIVYLLYPSANKLVRVLGIAGIVGMFGGVVVGLIGILLFALPSFNFVANKTFHLKHGNHSYETRRYAYTELLPDEFIHTFSTYRTFDYLPLEQSLYHTMIVETQTQVNLWDDSLEVSIQRADETEMLVLTDRNGESYTKRLD